jgi:acetyltransferase-like isoleucine patch superfamily enzyme
MARAPLRDRLRLRRVAAQTHRMAQVPPASAFAHFGQRSVIVPPARVNAPQFMRVGDDVIIHEQSQIMCEAGPSGQAPVLVIGDRVNLGPMAHIACTGRIEISDDVLAAARVFIGDSSHAFEDPDRPVIAQGMTNAEPVHIASGAFLGIGSVVLPGVRIGRGAVVGAGAVVSSDVPDHCLVVGNPARIIRRYNASTGAWEGGS